MAVAGIGGDECPTSGCGTNSPVFDTRLEFHDLSLVGTPQYPGTTVPNAQGLAIVAAGETRRAQIVQRGQSYDLHVVGGKFSGSCAPPCTPIAGPDLVGATITLTLNGKPSYVISIDDQREMFFFVDPAPQTQTIDAYTLHYKSLVKKSSGLLCNNVPLLEEQLAKHAGDEDFARYELMGMRTWETIVFEGDLINGVAKTMEPTGDDSWFNFGCASHLLAKLRLTRNTIHGQAPGLPDAWQRRQATMKMLAADYSGGGIANTVAGQKLGWTGDLMAYPRTLASIEARWDEVGAICLTEPRMLHPTSELGKDKFPDPWLAIEKSWKGPRKFPLPVCKPANPKDLAGTLRVSGNPPSP